MIAHNIVMQLGTQYGTNKETISGKEIDDFCREHLPENLNQFNGGYYTHQGIHMVMNKGYRESVHVISFILPDTTDMIDVVHRIREMYCKRFQQESVVTTITECEALL